MDNPHGTGWKDVTSEFMNCVSKLDLGELLKCDNLTLADSMSAIELMDPKIDSGMLLKKAGRKILSFDQAVEKGNLKINNLEPNELIGIIDESYACLVTWLEGHSLVQTVMTNIYLNEPEKIEDRCLRVFSLSILKITDYLDKLVQSLYCIEEEDFLLNYSRFPLASNISDQKVSNSLEDLCLYYEKCLSNLTASIPNNSNQQPSSNITTTNSNTDTKQTQDQQQSIEQSYDKSTLTALICRLRFTLNFLMCFRSVYKNLLDSPRVIEPQLIKKTIKLIQTTTASCDKNLEKCFAYTDKWMASIEFGIKPNYPDTNQEEDKSAKTTNKVDYPTIMGFDPLINRKFLLPAYPRCPTIKSRPETVEYLKNLIIKLRHCISISSISLNSKSYLKSLELIENFSKYFRPKSCVISRSFSQALYLPNKCLISLKDDLLLSMQDYCEPLIQKLKKDESSMKALDDFLSECSRIFAQAVCIYGFNSSRQHEKYFNLIQHMKDLQYSSFLIDNYFKNSILCLWTTCYMAKFCIKYILAGLELELFSAHEYPYVFWYLYDILYRNEREQLEIAKRTVLESQQLEMDNQQQQPNGNSSNHKNNKKQQRKQKVLYSTTYHDKCLMRIDAYRFLTGGIFLLTYGLRLQGKIRTPSMEFTSEEICFDHRFGGLSVNSVYPFYKETLNRLQKEEDIYREAFEYFQEAKQLFALIDEEDSCLKVCKTNMIVARILSTNVNSFTDREIEFNYDTHPAFPTVKL